MRKRVRVRHAVAARVGAGLLLLGLLPLTGTPLAGAAQGDYSPDEFAVARKDGEQIKPRIAGRFVVWQDYRNLPGAPMDEAQVNADIYARDIDANEDRRVTTNHTAARPAISGSKVVYADSRNKATSGLDIRGYNLDRDDVFDVVERSGDQDYPAIDGNLVVWQDNRSGNWDIRGKDLDSDDTFDVIVRDGDQKKPAISGKIVVWEDYRNGADQPDIRMKNLDTDDTRQITSNGVSRDPDVSGDYVVYRTGDPSSDDQRIRVYQISTGDVIWSSDRMRIDGGPRIDGSLVVWADQRNDEDDNIWGYDIAANVEFKVTTADKHQTAPDVAGTTVVWEEGRGDSPRDIRGARLTVPSSGSATPTSGVNAPPVGPPAQQGPCGFTLGFKTLHDMIPDVVGECLENEWHNADNGDGLQRTAGGLLVWRKADNWTAFTNGSITWLNGPCGLQTRPNEGPFYSWEGRIGASCS